MTGAILLHGTDVVIPLGNYSLSDGIPTLGENVNATPIALAASAGLAHLWVSTEPAFMIISRGDELIEPEEPIAQHQCEARMLTQ
jgi:molybdopterin biosynthesis enzyme